MKKRSKEDCFWQMKFAGMRCLKKFLFIFSLLVVVTQAYAQQKKVNISLKNVSLEKVFREVRGQSDYRFVYGSEEIKKVILPVVELENASINEVMDYCLKGTDFIYLLENNVVIVRKRDAQVQQKKSIRVKGFVRDAKKIPLPGVTVKVVGLSIGTATNEKGWFAIELPVTKGALEFSFIGFKKKTIEFSDQTAKDTLRITLEEDIQALDETVVVAYGNTTKRTMSGAVSVVKADEIKGIPSPSIANLLQGRVAGLDITNMSGAPGGGGTSMVIRGYNSLDVEQSRRFSNPLWVVDGVPLTSFTSPVTGVNLLADINPDMIESVQVLKDASSAAIYGSRAANGVIIITTKKGRKNQDATFSVNISQTWSVLPELPTITIGKAERTLRLKALRNDLIAYQDIDEMRYKYPTTWEEYYLHPKSQIDAFYDRITSINNGIFLQDSLNSFYNNSTNYFPLYYQRGKVTNANIQTYGGSERTSYSIGLGFYDEKGIVKGTGFNRIDLNSNLNVMPVQRLNVDLRLNASIAGRKQGSGNASNSFQTAPVIGVVPGYPFGLSSLYPGKGSETWDYTVEQLKGTKEKNRSVRLRTNFKLGYDIIEGLNLSTSIAADYSLNRRNYFSPSYLNQRGYSMSIGETDIYLMALSENLLSYEKKIGESHKVDAVFGCSYQYDQTEYNGASGENSPSDKIYYVRPGFPQYGIESYGDYQEVVPFQRYISDMTEKTLISYFARIEYNFREKYFLSASFRRDGSSTFGKDNKWGTFPSIAISWNFSEESFVKNNLPWISFGKLRTSWGRSGMHFYDCYLALGILQTGEYPFEGESVLEPDWLNGRYNQDLSWEETDQFDVGFDLDMFNYRLGITLDYYYRYTDKLLGAVSFPGNYNGWVSMPGNVGAISNAGVELLIKYEILRKSDLYWKIAVNGARNWNRYEKTYNGKDDYHGIIGKSLNGLYALPTDGFVNQQDDLPVIYNAWGMGNYLSLWSQESNYYTEGDLRFIDTNGDGCINSNDVVNVGSALPYLSGGIVSEFRWKNIDLNLSMSYQIGRHMYNCLEGNAITPKLPQEGLTHPVLVDLNHISFWQKEGDNSANYAKLQSGNREMYPYYTNTMIDRYVEKVNWLKLKTVTLGYSIPQTVSKKWGIEQVRFFVSGENLLTLTNYSGIDPETVDITTGKDRGRNYPLARKFTLGLTVKF